LHGSLTALPPAKQARLAAMSAGVQIVQDARGPVPEALRRFIWDIQSVVELAESEREILMIGRDLMARLIASDDCLPAAFSEPTPGAASQFQIYLDGMERFCVVSTILAGGAALGVSHSGREIMGVFAGMVDRGPVGERDARQPLEKGSVATLGSGAFDVTRLAHPPGGEFAVAIHVYGGEVGKLTRRLLASGTPDAQALGYANGADAPPYDIFSIQADIRD
jgi:3-mercaptopropionate dioxygenase